MIKSSHSSLWYVDYPISKMKNLCKVLKREEASILAFSVFVGSGILKHANAA